MRLNFKLTVLLLAISTLSGCGNSETKISSEDFAKFVTEHFKSEQKSAKRETNISIKEQSGFFSIDYPNETTKDIQNVTVDPFSLVEFEVIRGRYPERVNIFKANDYIRLEYSLPGNYYYDLFYPDNSEDAIEAVKEANDEIGHIEGFVTTNAKYNFDGYPISINDNYNVSLEGDFDVENEDGTITKKHISSVLKQTKESVYSDYTLIPASSDSSSNDESFIPMSGDITPETWLGHMDDNTPITRINLPGTHDSSTFGLPYARALGFPKTQNKPYFEQLKCGVRYFDLRTYYSYDIQAVDDLDKITFCHADAAPPSVKFYHCYTKGGTSDSKYRISLRRVVNDSRTFLDQYPNEFVIFQLKPEVAYTDKTGHRWTVEEIAQRTYSRVKKLEFLFPDKYKVFEGIGAGSKVPTIKECRGKICFSLQDSPGHNIYGNNCDVCNYYSDGWSAKKNDLTRTFNSSVTWASLISQRGQAKFYDTIDKTLIEPRIIHCSCYKDGFPAFNPLSCSNRVNPFVTKFNLSPNKYYGWVLFDYVTQNEAFKIYINNNFGKYKDTNWPTEQVQSIVKSRLGSDVIIPAFDKALNVSISESSNSVRITCDTVQSFAILEEFYRDILSNNHWVFDHEHTYDPNYELMIDYAQVGRNLVIDIHKSDRMKWPANDIAQQVDNMFGKTYSVIPAFHSKTYDISYDSAPSIIIMGIGCEEFRIDDYTNILKQNGWTTAFDSKLNVNTAIGNHKDLQIQYYIDLVNLEFIVKAFKYDPYTADWPYEEIENVISDLGATGEVLPYDGENFGFYVDRYPGGDQAPAIYIKVGEFGRTKADSYDYYLEDHGYVYTDSEDGWPIYTYPGTTLTYGAFYEDGKDYISIRLYKYNF